MTRTLLLLVSSGVAALAVGQLVVSLVWLSARGLVGPTRRCGLATFLVVRRLARVDGVGLPLRLVVAAATVAVVTATGASQASTWAQETAQLRVGGPARVVLADADAADALALSEDIDPDGEHLVAAVLVDGTGAPSQRRAYLDLRRVDRVLGGSWADTSLAPVAASLHDLVTSPNVNAGPTLTVGVRGVSARRSGVIDPVVQVTYVDPTGGTTDANVVLALPLDGSAVTGTIGLPGCDDGGCTITQVTTSRRAGDSTLPWVIDRLDFGGNDVLSLDWVPTRPDPDYGPGGLLQVDDGLLARASSDELAARPAPLPLPVLATDSVTWPGGATARTPGGEERDAVLVARSVALPLVEADGLLLDLSTALTGPGSSGTAGTAGTAGAAGPAAEVSVIVGAGTPQAMLDRLEQAAGAPVETLEDVRRAAARDAGAPRIGVDATTALGAALVVLVALVVGVVAGGRQRRSRRRDLVALRAVGVEQHVLAEAARLEQLVLGLGAAVGAAAGGLLGVRLLLPHLALLEVPDHAVPLTTVSSGPLLVAGAVGAAAVVAALASWGRRAEPPR